MSADLLRECECGCGQLAPIAKRTDARRGHVAGQPIRFVHGHGRKVAAISDADRFWAKVGTTSDCWEWLAATRRGYGHFHLAAGASIGAHRWAYEHLVEPIPAHLTIDHLCRNKRCVNPAHLEVVSRGENARRAAPTIQSNRCKWGHDFDAANTYIRRDGTRQCRACHRARQKGYADVC